MAVDDGDILRVSAQIVKDNDAYVNVYHLKASFTDSQPDEDVFDAVLVWLADAYDELDGLMNDGYDFDQVTVVNLTQDTVVGQDDWIGLTSGSNTTSDLPRQCAPVVRFPTNVLGSQGRKFLMGMSEDENTGSGNLSTALQTALGLFAAAILDGVTVTINDDLVPGNWNKVKDRFVPWVSAVINTFFGTQRRRIPGIGT